MLETDLEPFASVTCDLSQFYEMKSDNRFGPICLSPGMSCNNTCNWIDQNRTVSQSSRIAKSRRNLSYFDEFRRETLCVPYCDRDSEWQCGQACIPKEVPCEGQCPREFWKCKAENRCIPLKWVCDGTTQRGCADGSDEEECGNCADGFRRCGNKTLCSTALPGLPCEGKCPEGMDLCPEISSCVTHRISCAGKCLRDGYLPCGHQCYKVSERCDGKQDCGDGSDESNCDQCNGNGSKMCPESGEVVCRTEPCPEDLPAVNDKATCEERCDHFWCEREKRCIYRDDALQGCTDLKGFPSVDHAIFTNVSGPSCDSGIWDTTADGKEQVFKQASCLPDRDGNCPSSFRVSDEVTKLWIKCGSTCWTKEVLHKKHEIPHRYQLISGEVSLRMNPKCHQESFPDLCLGKCKFYDAWFCHGELICTDQACDGRCPSKAGPDGLEFYFCPSRSSQRTDLSGECMPVTTPCNNKCPTGRFRCGALCLNPEKVCDGYSDCLNGEDESKDFCNGCTVGQTICNGKPLCIDQKCNGVCYKDPRTNESFVDCEFEGSEDRNICARRRNLCDSWMEFRFGKRFINF